MAAFKEGKQVGYDAIVVGCGLAGGVIARHLAEQQGKRVLILERRGHIAGNLYDEQDENGIMVQKYGPHSFHTKEKRLFDYVSQFGEWEPYYLRCMVFMDGRFTPSPFNFQTIDDFCEPEEAARLKRHLAAAFPGRDRATIVEMLKAEDALVAKFARFLFEKDYSLYTAKQWGISPQKIDISVLERVPVVFSYQDKYFNDAYQVMPKGGFTRFYQRLIDHPGIQVQLNIDARAHLSIKDEKIWMDGRPIDIPVVYTGPIDELLNGKYGYLPYRSLRFEYRTEPVDSYQAAPIVAYPQAEGYTRITEYTKLPEQMGRGKTVIAVEYPLQYQEDKGIEPYYPILTEESQRRYQKYQKDLAHIPNLFLCGRLADFKYYNMDQALARALEVCHALDNNAAKC